MLVAFLLATAPAWAQNPPYLLTISAPAFAAPAPVENGFDNLANGNLHIEIPLVAASQRGHNGFSASLVYDSRIWQIGTPSLPSWQLLNVLNFQGGWRFVTSADTGSIVAASQSCQGCSVIIGPFTWTDSARISRVFQESFQVQPCTGTPQTQTAYAPDSSGFRLVSNMTASCVFTQTIYAPDGTQVYPTVTDPNGNYFSKDANGNVIDTLGRVQVTKTTNGSTTYYDVVNSQGTTSRFTVATTTVRECA